MKKNYAIMTLIAMNLAFVALLATGCNDSRTKRLETINALYLDIKTIVTDPNVQPLIPEDKRKDLAALERIYLVTVMKLQTAQGPQDKTDLAAIVDCGTALLGIIDNIALGGEYSRQIQAVRLGIKILSNHIGGSAHG